MSGPGPKTTPARVGGFLVRATSPGITIERTWDHLGLRASRSDDVIFTGTPVPYEATTGLAAPRARAARCSWPGTRSP